MVSTAGSERKTDRAEAFSDAVLAIAITLPLADLHAPRAVASTRLGNQYAALAADYVAYALSFVVIGLYWAYSHFSGKLWRKTDHGFNLLTLLFLGSVSSTPFPARPFVEHLGDPADARTAAIVYAWMLAAPATLWTFRWFYGVWRGLLDPHLAAHYVRETSCKYRVDAGTSVTGAIVATVISWPIGLAIVALVTLSYLLPPMAPEFKPGESPRDDIQEADEDR